MLATRILDPKIRESEKGAAAAAPATPWPKTEDQGSQQWRVKWPTSCCHPSKSKPIGEQTIGKWETHSRAIVLPSSTYVQLRS